MRHRVPLLITAAVASALMLGYVFVRTNEPAPPATPVPSGSDDAVVEPISVVARGLDTPWDVAFLPEGDLLVTERPGRIRRFGGGRDVTIELPGVREFGEAGQMGIALHPDFASNHHVYLSQTVATQGKTENRVVRYVLERDALRDEKVIIAGIPAAANHDGGRLAFGPDGMLYVTTGDAGVEALARDRNSLAGKILRVRDDGSIPDGNPFGTAVWSTGHRNPQGITWDDRGRLWSTEHGRSGARSGLDELNLIEPGRDYGWPESQGDTVVAGTTGPVRHSGPNETWAPAGIAFANGRLFFAGLRGESLYEAATDASAKITSLRAHLRKEYGRLRAVRTGPDGMLYVGTSNRDGRGLPRAGDDKILRIDPAHLMAK